MKYFIWVETALNGMQYIPVSSIDAALDILGLWFQVHFNADTHTFSLIEGDDNAPHPSDDSDEMDYNWREVLIGDLTIDEVLEDKYALSTK